MDNDLLDLVAEILSHADIPVYRTESGELDSLLLLMRLPGAAYEEPSVLPITVTEATIGTAVRFSAVVAAVRPKRRAAVQEQLSAFNARHGSIKFYLRDDAVMMAAEADLSLLAEDEESILGIAGLLVAGELVNTAHKRLRAVIAEVYASLTATAKGRKPSRPRVLKEAEDVVRDAFNHGSA